MLHMPKERFLLESFQVYHSFDKSRTMTRLHIFPNYHNSRLSRLSTLYITVWIQTVVLIDPRRTDSYVSKRIFGYGDGRYYSIPGEYAWLRTVLHSTVFGYKKLRLQISDEIYFFVRLLVIFCVMQQEAMIFWSKDVHTSKPKRNRSCKRCYN